MEGMLHYFRSHCVSCPFSLRLIRKTLGFSEGSTFIPETMLVRTLLADLLPRDAFKARGAKTSHVFRAPPSAASAEKPSVLHTAIAWG